MGLDMLLLNRSASWPELDLPAGADLDAEPEADFEDELIALLGRLEHLRERMSAARTARRPGQWLPTAEEILSEVGGFAKQHCPFATGREMEVAVAARKALAKVLANLRERTPNGETGSSDPEPMRCCVTALYDMVAAHFVVFTNRFPTSRSARDWVDVAATYLVDLKHLTDPFPAR
jgi:hypothetical protein